MHPSDVTPAGTGQDRWHSPAGHSQAPKSDGSSQPAVNHLRAAHWPLDHAGRVDPTPHPGPQSQAAKARLPDTTWEPHPDEPLDKTPCVFGSLQNVKTKLSIINNLKLPFSEHTSCPVSSTPRHR